MIPLYVQPPYNVAAAFASKWQSRLIVDTDQPVTEVARVESGVKAFVFGGLACVVSCEAAPRISHG
jgi:hypothetical protein